ncbi:C2H2 finger domain protein [Acephala macrosclerotiorum]|nr:C2H2 finger domain protein [Acephala macrosclerotiorum]
MRHRQTTPSSSSSDSDGSDIESCFDTEDEQEKTNADTEPTDVDTDVDDVDGCDEADLTWIAREENAHLPEYYLDQENNSDESEDENEDYSDGSLLLLDMIERNFYRYCKYVRKDPARVMQAVSRRTLKAFFEWMLNQRQGKSGKKLAGIQSASTLGTYWKVFRLVYERATGEKIERKMNRHMHRVLRKLAKKYRLSTKKRDNVAMYIEDLAGVLQTNLTTTKQRYTHGRQRIQTSLFCQLAIFSANRPSALLKLRYGDIAVNLLRDPSGGPHRILIEFTCEFTKKYLGTKDANTFVLPEIIFDPSLILSPHVALLGLIFADNAFLAPSLTSAERISELDIPSGYEQLPLRLKPKMADIPVFRKSIRTPYGWEISPDQPLPYTTLLKWMKRLGVLTGFPQITRPYCLRYGAGNAFNQSVRYANRRLTSDVSDALQNMIMQHAKIDTFIKHYLRRKVTVDTRAIVSGYEPQRDLMRAACRMTRWIDPNRPQELTPEESLSVNQDPVKRRFQGTATRQPGYRIIGRAIFNTRQRLRTALLKYVQERWDLEHPVDEIERQLSGLKLSQDVKTTLDQNDEMPPLQKRLAETVMTLPSTTIEKEFRRRNAGIDAVAAYCHFQEGRAAALPHKKSSTRRTSPMPSKETSPQLAAAQAEKQALSDAMLLVFTEKKTTTCFLCLGEQSLPFEKRTYKFASPGDLIKHFKRKHLAHIKEGDQLKCKVCRMSLQYKAHLQNHALSIHGTVF